MVLAVHGNAASGIGHLKPQLPAVHRDAQVYTALLGEFQSVVQQIAQDLQQALAIGMHTLGHMGIDLA